MTRKRTAIDPLEQQHWEGLARRLPAGGVSSVLATEIACRDRFAAARWPAGVTCPDCGAGDFSYLEGRKIYCCRACRYQFTILVGSVLQSSKLPVQLWFEAAEEYIRWRAANARRDYGLHAFADFLGVAYSTARRARFILKSDLAPDGAGLLARCICRDAEAIPPSPL